VVYAALVLIIGTCALCRTQNVAILNSHLLPAFAYKRLQGTARDLVHRHDDRVFRSSKQIRKHSLCAECEKRFGVAETYVSRLCYDDKSGTAPIHKLLTQEAPDFAHAHVDGETLAYLAASIVWRGDVMNRPALGKYREPLREYLLGEAPFPAHAIALLNVFPEGSQHGDLMAQMACVPVAWREDGYYRHPFIMCGLQFELWVGNRLPKTGAEICLSRMNPPRVWTIPAAESGISRSALESFGSAHRSRDLQTQLSRATANK
jgi:hypothetical protein